MEDFTIYDMFIDDADIEIKNINDMTLKQLVIYKKQLQELNDCTKLTKNQLKKQKEFKIALWEEYDATQTNSNYLNYELHNEKRKWECNMFKAKCIELNKQLFKNASDIINQIETLEQELKTQSAEKYKVDQKIYANEKVTCECGIQTIRKNKSTHKKSKVHQIWEKKQEEIKTKILTKIPKIKPTIKSYPVDEQGNGYFELDSNGNQILLYDNNGSLMLPKDRNGFTILAKVNLFTF